MPVGFRQGRFEDATRPNWDGSGPRPLTWAAWYPASDASTERELFPDRQSETWFSIGPAARDAPIDMARRRYPIVMLSHGTGGQPCTLNGWRAIWPVAGSSPSG
jgi:predicted dienelactone hydrolase